VTGWEGRELQPGPVFRQARGLYQEFVETCRIVEMPEIQRTVMA
jgi:branched-chain amino acid aminotransferase